MKTSHLLLISILFASFTLNASASSFFTQLQDLAMKPQVKQVLGNALMVSGTCSATLVLSELASIKDYALSTTVKSVFTSMPRFLAMGLSTAMLRYRLTEITDSRIVWFCVAWFAVNALTGAINIEFTKTSETQMPGKGTSTYKYAHNHAATVVTVNVPTKKEALHRQDSRLNELPK